MSACRPPVNPRQPVRRAGGATPVARTLAAWTLAAWTLAALLPAGRAAAQGSPVMAPLEGISSSLEPSRLAAAEVRVTCERIGGKLASVSVAECLAQGLEPSGAYSVDGTPILLREFRPLPGRAPLGRVLLFGGIHGDEYSSVTIVFKWLSILARHHSGLFHWRVVPLLNPDGLLRRRSQRMNHRGVDLNRNFPTVNWYEETEYYWVRRTSRNARRYPGPAPLSEPESRWLAEEIERFRPSAIVAVHAPIHVVDYDGPPEPPDRLGPLRFKPMGTYPGSLGRYAGAHLGLPVVTIELPSAGIMPSPAGQSKIWTDLVAWLVEQMPRNGHHKVAVAPRPMPDLLVEALAAQRSPDETDGDGPADGDGLGAVVNGEEALPACRVACHQLLPCGETRCW